MKTEIKFKSALQFIFFVLFALLAIVGVVASFYNPYHILLCAGYIVMSYTIYKHW